MQEDLKGVEPNLGSEAGLTEAAAAHAGSKGYADMDLHAGFITKQSGLPPPEGQEHVSKHKARPVHHEHFDVEPAQETSGAEDLLTGGGAGATEKTAQAAGSHGYVDKELHAGFVTKQTPLA